MVKIMVPNPILGGGNSNIFYFHPYLGKIPILTNIFQMGWNHQPVSKLMIWGVIYLYFRKHPCWHPQTKNEPFFEAEQMMMLCNI